MKRLVLLFFLSTTTLCFAQEDSVKAAATEQSPSEPFAWGDFTWLQGNSRLHKQALDSKYFTGDMTLI